MLEVKINNNTINSISFQSLSFEDQRNQGSSTCSFSLLWKAGDTKPAVNDDIKVYVDDVLSFAGVITSTTQEAETPDLLRYEIKCQDYSPYLNRKLVTERLENTTLKAAITFLIETYAGDYGFTAGANVKGNDVSIRSVSFNALNLSECLDKLASMTNFFWYIGWDKDIHFFRLLQEEAPFNLTDNSNNYIFNSLSISDDFSQMRNVVKVTGSKGITDERSLWLRGDGEQNVFNLAYEFANQPVVKVNGVAVDVGIDFLMPDADFDVMWSFSGKYLRFTDGNIPPAPSGDPTDLNIEVIGQPLRPIVIQRQNNASVLQYGVYEFAIADENIKTRSEAIQLAQTQLAAYAQKINEGGFRTYQTGLHSGQTININSTLRDINEDFIIQAVRFRQRTKDDYEWEVKLATVRTMSLIDFLQNLLLSRQLVSGEDETLLKQELISDDIEIDDTVTYLTFTSKAYQYSAVGGDPQTQPAIWNKSTWGAT